MKIRTGHAQAGSLITGNSSTFVSAQKTFDTMEIFTVTIDVDLPTSGVAAFVTATVRWTVKGVTVTRTYDVATTASFSGIAEALTVTVNDNTPNTHPQGVKYNASILIAIGTKAVASAGAVGGVGWQVGAPTRSSVVLAKTIPADILLSTVNFYPYLQALVDQSPGSFILDGPSFNPTTMGVQFVPWVAGSVILGMRFPWIIPGSGALPVMCSLWNAAGARVATVTTAALANASVAIIAATFTTPYTVLAADVGAPMIISTFCPFAGTGGGYYIETPMDPAWTSIPSPVAPILTTPYFAYMDSTAQDHSYGSVFGIGDVGAGHSVTDAFPTTRFARNRYSAMEPVFQ
jgi:hypothetical protein